MFIGDFNKQSEKVIKSAKVAKSLAIAGKNSTFLAPKRHLQNSLRP